MLTNPKPGQRVVVWYRASRAAMMPWHGRSGVVSVVSRGRPRNHGVLIDGVLVVVPCGNLKKEPGNVSGS